MINMMSTNEDPEPMDIDGENSSETPSSSQGTREQTSVPKKARAYGKQEGREFNIKISDRPRIIYDDTWLLGLGASAHVYRGEYKENDRATTQLVAVKKINGSHYDIARRERNIWMSLKDKPITATPNVIRLLWEASREEGRQRDDYHYFVMELAQTDLAKKVEECGKTPESFQREAFVGYLRDAATGLEWLHDQKPSVVHCDIKPDNILIFTDPSGKEVAKISDFGVSRKLTSFQKTGTYSITHGAPFYQPPELLKNISNRKADATGNVKKYVSLRGDIFSLGITAFYTISCGKHPFNVTDNDWEILINIINATPMSLKPPECLANHLFSWMMAKDFQSRPYINHVLLHPFFWSKRTSYEFLREVGMAFDSKDTGISALRDKINSLYLKCVPNFDWKKQMGDDVMNIFLTMHKKNYGNGDSIMKFVEFIRDKTTHYQDFPKDLLREQYFGDENGTLCTDKFTSFIEKRFSNVIGFLFVALAWESAPFLAKLKKQFKMTEFKRSPAFLMPAKPVLKDVKNCNNEKLNRQIKKSGKGTKSKSPKQSNSKQLTLDIYLAPK